MTDRPILFSAPMVRALLAGTKKQTRRILKPKPRGTPWFWAGDEVDPTPGWFDGYEAGREPCGEATMEVNDPIKVRILVGDRLWVRETWQGLTCGDYRPTKQEPCEVRYAATDPCADLDVAARGYPWRPSIFMPRFASRLTLTVTDVRVERLQDISEADAIAEGCGQYSSSTPLSRPFNPEWKGIYREGYAELWNQINGPGAWEANPWVAAYTFTVNHSNIDQIAKEAA